ncbi:tetratricopeptide repeat protein [Candidatus Poribacteria bacterium]|nr:tetratricopeptide repeat protein [Candidatus Poribacteria bacterium]MYH80708.1 tetratricopeptide repeat protein [Candidatus Poribacteria bacterium]MYK96246.1 tetratricopeptide repeat protein [Candidatus Poribacteria bacterium]
MQHPMVPLLSEKYSAIDIGSSPFAQHGQITKERTRQRKDTILQLIEKTVASTVFLEMECINGQPLGFGSGFFVQHNQIATNFHVIAGASRGTAKLFGKPYDIEGITASDVENDLAVLKVSDSSVQPLPLGDSDAVQLGDTVYVFGNPKESEGAFSDGTISGSRAVGIEKLLQMTAPISLGGSGGPVLNEKGEVIGLAFVTLEDGQNLNCAIPSKHLKSLISKPEVVKPLTEEEQSVSAETHFYRGNEKYLMRVYQDAITAYNEAIRLQPDFANAYVNRGLAKEKLGQHESAIMDYSSAIEIDSTLAGAYNNRGSAQRRLGQYFLALEDLSTAIQLDPRYVKAYVNRGNAKNSLGHPNEALEDFNTALALDPDSAEAYNNRGVAKAALMQLPDAIEDFNTAIELNPELVNAYYSRGIAKFIIGKNIREAEADLQTALKLAKKIDDANLKSNVELALSRLAENAYRDRKGSKGNSIKLFITYTRQDEKAKDKLITYLDVMKSERLINIWYDNEILPGDRWRDSISKNLAQVDILLYLVSANSLASENCNRELAEALNTNIRVVPIILEHCDWLDHYLSDFQVLPRTGKPIDAWQDEDEGWQSTIAGIREVIHQIQTQAASPSDISQKEVLADLKYQHGNFLMVLRKIEEAIKAYSDVIELNPHYSAAYNNRGVVYTNKGEYDLAIRDFNIAIDLNPNDSFAYNNRGNAYNDISKVDKAIKDFNTAIDLKPDYSNAYNNRGNAYVKKHSFDKAIEDFNTAIKLDPSFAGAYNSRGAAYHEKGNLEKAIEDFSEAIKLDSNYVSPYINRGRVRGRKGMISEAIGDFSKVIELRTDYADAYYDRGVAHGKKRDFDLAIVDYTKAIQLKPIYTEAYCNRGSAYFSKGEFNLAIADYTKAIELDPDSGEVYCNRGLAWLVLQNWNKARADIASAKRIGLDIVDWFHKLYKSVENFERIIGAKLPEDIAVMLTS